MSEEEPTEPLQEQTEAKTLLGGEGRTTSPFDSLFSEGALDTMPDGAAKSWVAAQKTGIGFEKGLQGLQKLGSSKGIERPAEDATDESKAAFDTKLRELQGIPLTAEEYEFKTPEGFYLPDDLTHKIKEFGVEKGIPPSNIEQLLPFQVELQNISAKMAMDSHIDEQMKIGDEYFGGEGTFDTEAPKLAAWADKQGYDSKTDPAFRNATTYKLLSEIQRLTGEDKLVTGTPVVSGESLRAQLHDIQFNKENPMNAALTDTTSSLHADAKAKFLDLNKRISGLNTNKSIRRL